jgi:hypothetical protein
MVLWSLSNEILWPHSVESSSYFRLIEQISYLQSKTGLKNGEYSPQEEKHDPPPPVHIRNVQLPQEDIKYLGLCLDRRLTWHKHIFIKNKQLGITPLKSKLSTSNKLLI